MLFKSVAKTNLASSLVKGWLPHYIKVSKVIKIDEET